MDEHSKKVSNESTTEKNKDEHEVNYDQLVLSAGEFGKYQLLLFFYTCPFYIFGVFSYFTQLFMTEVSPQHWCWIPELENLTSVQRRQLAIPVDEKSSYGYSRCLSYQANWTEVLSSGIRPDETWATIPCQNGWEFNKTDFDYSTISSELGWVCDKDSYQATAQSVFFVGAIVGGFLFGLLADKFGRIPAVVLSNLIGAIAGVASSFTQDFAQFAICRFFMGLSYDSCMIMIYLIVMEYISPKYRTVITNLSFAIFFTLAAVALPWIAKASGDWKTLSLITSLPMALAVLSPLIIPESPMWLLSKGRVDDAVNKVLVIARTNNKNIPQELIEKFKRRALDDKNKNGGIMDLLRKPLLRKAFMCACVLYMCIYFVFDALIRIIGQLHFDFFISFSLISSTELPSLFILSFTLDYTGRKLMLLSTLSIAAVFSVIILFSGGGLGSVMCAFIARFGVNMAVNATWQWIAEMLPTSVRGSGTSIVHIFGYLATVLSPFVTYFDTYMMALPTLIIGSVAILAALIALVLPETAKKEMPLTFDEAEHLISNQTALTIPFLHKKKCIETDNLEACVNPCFELN